MIPIEELLKGKILIIDDEAANVMVLEETLKQRGYTSIKSLTDPREALETYNAFKPDLILLDMNMPHLTGFQVMDQIQQADSRNIPIMILTAQIDQTTRLRALDAGARDFLTKPFDILEVSLRIQNMLEISLLYNQMRNSNSSVNEKYEQAIIDLTATKLKLQNETSRREKLEEQLSGSSMKDEFGLGYEG
jgi:putative two-component system response regulator